MLLTFLLFVAGASASTPTVVAVPGEVVRLADGIRRERERGKRIELLRGLIADLKRRVSEIPDDISEADVPKVEILYELNILFGNLKPEAMNPATCPSVFRTLRQMTNPSGIPNPELSPPGRLALDVVASMCAP